MVRRLSLATIIGLLALLLSASPVAAGLIWCQGDPIVSLNGTRVQILLAIPVEHQPLVNGPIEVEIGVPGAIPRHVVATDQGFNGHGERVTFTEIDGDVQGKATFPAVITTHVPADVSRVGPGVDLPVMMTIIVGEAEPVVVYGTVFHTRAAIEVPVT